jgi:hypothetical protein
VGDIGTLLIGFAVGGFFLLWGGLALVSSLGEAQTTRGAIGWGILGVVVLLGGVAVIAATLGVDVPALVPI